MQNFVHKLLLSLGQGIFIFYTVCAKSQVLPNIIPSLSLKCVGIKKKNIFFQGLCFKSIKLIKITFLCLNYVLIYKFTKRLNALLNQPKLTLNMLEVTIYHLLAEIEQLLKSILGCIKCWW